MENEVMNLMDNINYGVPNENNENLLELIDEEEVFNKYYYLQSPEELKKSKLGTCFDQTELERKYFEERKIPAKTYFICSYDYSNSSFPSHTFLTFTKNDKHYWFEHSWVEEKGIHEYNSEKELLTSVKEKFITSHQNEISPETYTHIYLYDKPKSHISCKEFYEYVTTGQLIKLNKPLYFYHLVSKESNLTNGLLSLEYMYKNNMDNLFDKNAEKYKSRIVNSWNIEEYVGRKEESLTREEIIDALKKFRGPEGANYIYFFRYPPYKELGPNMKKILENKDIYKININDEEVESHINEIFYGYNMSHSDNQKLDKKYYENITKTEYFSKYDDSLKMNFSTLNHISIAFKNYCCPLELLEKVEITDQQ